MENILFSSLAVSALALVVLVFRQFRGEKYSRRLFRALWVIVILRMIIPFNFFGSLAVIKLPQNELSEQIYSSSNEVPFQQNDLSETLTDIGDEIIVQNPANPRLPSEIDIPEAETQTASRTTRSWTTNEILFAVWAAGMVASLSWLMLSYMKFRRDLKEKLRPVSGVVSAAIKKVIGKSIQIFTIDSDESPMVVGVFRPMLILPKRLLASIESGDELSPQLEAILKHEQAHIRRRDILLKKLYLVGRAVQWFNPLAYMIRQPLNEDIELAADEAATAGMEKAERGAYCQSILEVAEMLPVNANNYSTRFTGDVKSMKKRIQALINADKTRRGISVLITILVAAALTLGLVSCEMEPSDPVGETQQSENGLTTVGNLLSTADTCQDFYLTVGTEFEIEYDQENFPAYGENPASPLDTTGAIHQLGMTVNQAAGTYRYQFKAVSPGTLTMVSPGNYPSEPFNGALFSFIVLDDKEAEELGVEQGQLVRPTALPRLENDYSQLNPEQLVREYYHLLNEGRPDQAYQLRFASFQCQQTPTLFTRMFEEAKLQTEVLSVQKKADWDEENNQVNSEDKGDMPGVCERLIVEKKVTGSAVQEQYPEEVVFVVENDVWKIASIAEPTCCSCNAYHEQEQTHQPEPVSVTQFGELTLYEYSLDPLQNADGALAPLTWEGDPINAALAGKPLKYLTEKIVIGENTYFAHCNPEKSDCIAQVEKDGEVIFEVLSQNPQASPVVLGTIRSFWKLDESWVLEVAREWDEGSDPETAIPVGEIYLDGELINERYDYDTAFEFQILNGKPFFFFKQDGTLGFSYDWQEYKLPFSSIHHYRCCSAGINKPRHFENLVNFVTFQDNEVQYYELLAEK